MVDMPRIGRLDLFLSAKVDNMLKYFTKWMILYHYMQVKWKNAKLLISRHTNWLDVDPMLLWCWSTVYDTGTRLKQHLSNVSYLLV